MVMPTCDDTLDVETEPSEERLKTRNPKKKKEILPAESCNEVIEGERMQEERVGGRGGGGRG